MVILAKSMTNFILKYIFMHSESGYSVCLGFISCYGWGGWGMGMEENLSDQRKLLGETGDKWGLPMRLWGKGSPGGAGAAVKPPGGIQR